MISSQINSKVNSHDMARLMIDVAKLTVDTTDIEVSLTLGREREDCSIEFVMVGHDARSHRLLVAATDQPRLNAHWNGFVSACRANAKSQADIHPHD